MEGPFVAPRTPMEGLLSAIWSDALGDPGISIHENFFDLGGNSLMALKIVRQINDEFDVNISLQDLVLAPTIADLAALISQMKQKEEND